MEITGKWYPKGSARQHSALLTTNGDNYELYVDNTLYISGLLTTLYLDNRLGNITRQITLEDSSVFTSDEHEKIDKVFSTHQKANRLLYFLETKTSWVILSFVTLLVSIYLFVTIGIPYFSQKIAYALPNETNHLLTTQTMEILDKHLFKESQIPKKKQMQIIEHFEKELLPYLPEQQYFTYHINFRLFQDGNLSLPNAMALPSGEIILTDKFVELCDNYEELDVIILHEVGHIIHRDSLTMLVEGTFISASVMVALGDLNGFADMGVGLGSMLLNMQYSREHETKADQFAFKQMLLHKKDPAAFATIMHKMEQYMKTHLHQDTPFDTNEYISTHPQTTERIERAKHFSDSL